jgi:hypothetical protein
VTALLKCGVFSQVSFLDHLWSDTAICRAPIPVRAISNARPEYLAAHIAHFSKRAT